MNTYRTAEVARSIMRNLVLFRNRNGKRMGIVFLQISMWSSLDLREQR